MHRISTTPGDWNPQIDGVVLFAQTPAPLVLLTATDTDIQTLAAAATKLPMGFPTFRVANLLQLQQQIVIDTYAEDVLEKAQVIILRLLGGRSYWSYGLEVVRETARRTGAALIVIPGDDAIDPDLIAHSTVPLAVGDRLWRYFLEGGVENAVNALLFTADFCLHTSYNPQPPQVVPRVGLYGWKGVGDKIQNSKFKIQNGDKGDKGDKGASSEQPITNYQLPATNYQLPITNYQLPKIGILFYRAHYLAGNTGVIDDLCQALVARNLLPVPVFVSSLRDPQVQADVLSYFQPKDEAKIQVLLNTTSFSLTRIFPTPERQFARAGENEQATGSSRLPTAANLWQQLDIPILQVIFSSSSISTWETSSQGLSPRDIGMNVALPEVDGRIISRAVSFKAVQSWNTALETNVVVYESVRDRLEFVAELTQRWVQLRSRPPAARKIALILANYPNRDGRLANGVGLDTPASCIEILKLLQQAGYQVENLPQTGDELIQRLTSGVTNDPDSQWRSHPQQLSWQEYQQYFATLPEAAQQEIVNRWDKRAEGAEEAEGAEGVTTNYQLPTTNYQLPIPGIQLGNVFVGIQPARGYDRDPALNYHAPDLEPPHTYLAFYYWLRQHFGADAIVHVGKHGNLEWLPGKSVALSSQCYPEIALGAMPHFYPFIVNDPGEGSQAKRRAQAVIIDHLTPPMTRAELYGALHQLESLVDEYYEAQSLDPTRLPAISDRIWQLIVQENLHLDLGMERESGGKRAEGAEEAEGAEGEKQPTTNNQQPTTINQLDGYLCELKEAQIRDGLHIFGQCPQGEQLRDLIVAIARQPNSYQVGITRAIAQAWELDFDPLTTDFSTQLSETSARILSAKTQTPCHIIGDAIEVLEQYAAELVEVLIGESGVGSRESEKRAALELGRLSGAEGEKTQLPITHYPLPITNTLNWIRDRLLPALAQTQQEITNLLRGLDGRYVPSGASGAPTRGRPEVLPTGKNFYSVDIRAIPTETAWDIGRKAAEALIERYTQENGEYPKTLGLSIWGTSTMRTGGDDIAEALALLGVRPVWDGVSRRVVDFEIVPLSVLARPRVDVTLRISGFFRDAFPNLIDLFDSAVIAVSQLDEPAEQNPLAAKVKHETQFWYSAGLTPEQAKERSLYRVFGSKPGAYGAGLQGLIEAQNWTGDRDLAHAYINWSCYAYSRNSEGRAAPEAFEQRLGEMQIVLHNQDNREHDLLDSDDYYQFQGGLTVAVRAVRGKNPQTYFGDNSIPANPRIRDLKEEIAKVYRSRVVNPKWIAGVMRHGYKGAFEMAATVDYLFAYDATAHCVEDYMYQGIAEAYLFDPAIQDFVQQKNPWALRDMAERLIEAKQRGLWQVTPEIIDKLRAIAHQAEGAIEEN
jgi:cobaltochelatase CobN